MSRSAWRSDRGAWQGGGSLCLGPSLCLPWAGDKAAVIGDTQLMAGVGPILLRFVFMCRPRAWSACRPCALARVRPPVAAPAGAGSGGHGGARRAGSAVSPPWARRPLRGEGSGPLCLGGR